MNLQEFEDAIVADELKESATITKWKKLCSILSELDHNMVTEMIHNGFLAQLIEIESQDGFGTKVIKL